MSNLTSSPPRIPIARTWVDEREAAAACRPLEAGWLTQGPEVAAFEREFAAHVGAAHACAVSNCTAALHLALLVAGVCPGDEVVTVSHSFIATANSIRYCGAIPVFVDIDPLTYNIDPELIARALTPRTRAIVCVHQLGMPCDLQRVTEIARRHGIPVIEDAACAAGSEIQWNGAWERIGKPHGDIACFSFHPRKVITTGDGGMLTTARADWDAQFRLLRQHGMSVPDTVRHASAAVIPEQYSCVGYNYRLTDLQAAVGREQLKRLPEIFVRRRQVAARYSDLLGGIAGLGLPSEPAWARTNWQSYCVRLPDHASQPQVMQALLDRGIASRRGVMCAHREPAYAHQPWRCGARSEPGVASRNGSLDLRESETATDRCILLPLFAQLTEPEQRYIADSLRDACGQPPI
jgi:dTDP-4-amino-4,6-dideoxygalactose transaminase